MNKLIFITLLILTLSIDKSESERFAFLLFQKFIIKYNKQYNSVAEYLLRFNIFKKNLERLSQNKSLYKIGINQFTDLTQTEFRKNYLNLDMKLLNKIHNKKVSINSKNAAPESWNWVDQGIYGPVKEQSYSGTVWAYSIIGNIEGLNAMKSHEYVALSEQQIFDCSTSTFMEEVYTYLMEKGSMKAEDYHSNDTCNYEVSKVFLWIENYFILDTEDENEIKEILYSNGPLAIAINADTFQYYISGIIDDDKYSCDPEGLNHAAVLVGYGNENGLDYWIIRNSWGKNWGEKGYVRVSRGKGTCGVNKCVSSAILKK